MRIVVGLDRTPPSKTAYDLILDTVWPSGTEFLFIHVGEGDAAGWASAIPGGAWFDDGGTASSSREELATLDDLADPVRRLGHPVEVRVEEGQVGRLLREAAEEWSADLIVVGSRRRGAAASAILGSVSADLVDHAPCPVLVVREPRVTRVLVATDGSHAARAIPQILDRWRAFRGLPIEVVSVAPKPMSTELMITPWATPPIDEHGRDAVPPEPVARHHAFAEQLVDSLVENGRDARAAIRVGKPADEIVAAAHDLGCDLVVTGSRGLDDLRRLLSGSVAHRVLLHAPCSVLVMRGHVPARVERSSAAAVAVATS